MVFKEWKGYSMKASLGFFMYELNHENRSAVGSQNKVDAWNGYQIKN